MALKETGLHIVISHGPTPPGFESAIYGVTSNSQGASVSFGPLFVGMSEADKYYRPSLLRLVPGATETGSTSGNSFIEITDAGGIGSSMATKSQQNVIAGELRRAVSRLAPQAVEGP